jgi:hypothetical protein
MENTFVTVARFQYSTEAQIIKGRLEADGIEVFLKDNITIDTDPLVSQAIGGIKLNVLAKDEAKAKEILEAVSAYALDDEGKVMVCPHCESTEISLYSSIQDFKSFFHFLIGFITGTLPFSARYHYKCENCDTIIDTKNS